MTKFDKIKETIYSKENWIDENEFLKDILFSSSMTLISKCYKELEDGETIVSIPPLLRQVQENIVVILGLLTKNYTIEEFIENKKHSKKIFNRIKQNEKEDENKSIERLDKFLQDIKDILSDYSHTSFNGAMALFTDIYQTPVSRQFNKSSMLILIHFIEAPLIALINMYYDLKVDLPSSNVVRNEFMKIKTLKYVTNNMPKPIQEFIDDSVYLSEYYKKINKSFEKDIKALKEFKN